MQTHTHTLYCPEKEKKIFSKKCVLLKVQVSCCHHEGFRPKAAFKNQLRKFSGESDQNVFRVFKKNSCQWHSLYWKCDIGTWLEHAGASKQLLTSFECRRQLPALFWLWHKSLQWLRTAYFCGLYMTAYSVFRCWPGPKNAPKTQLCCLGKLR